LKIPHGIAILRLCGAFCHLLGGEILQACLNPPEIAKGIAYSSHAVAKAQGIHLGDRSRSSCQSLLVHSIPIRDVEAQEARSSRPLLSSIKRHDDAVTNFGFGMANGTIPVVDPPQLLCPKRF